ncbi:MAG: TauD/TfdA family dioxygenase [Candidatus Competibacterales bacterium]
MTTAAPVQHPGATADPTATLQAVDRGSRHLVVHWADGHQSRYNYLWLRDNCPSGGSKLSAVRTFTVVDMDPDLAPVQVERQDPHSLTITWPGGATSVFQGTWLRNHCHEPASVAARKRPLQPWTAAQLQGQLPSADLAAVETDPVQQLGFLEQLADYGFVLVRGVPAKPEGTERLARQVGYIRETDFGRVFDIISEPTAWDLSQSQEALHPHTDDPYRYSPPGISVLHCLQASEGEGGRSLMVDGLGACLALRQADPCAFELLATVAVPFIRYREDPVPQGADVHLRAVAPVINLDRDGDVCGLRFHERSMAPLDMDPALMDDYYRALIELCRLLYGERFCIGHQLQPGEAWVFDNQRVLHGRSSFKGGSGRRHLRICTTDRDAFHSRLRLALSRHQRPGAHDALPAGAL